MRAKRIALLGVVALAVFLIGCPIPQVGVTPPRDLTGGETSAAGSATGSISVVNDEARGQAVYINESGQRFDVVAPEYDGGPLVKCVSVADFTLVSASSESDALPVKALVVGTRDDGSPGVWQINTDDTITLPQPEVTADNTARCIVGGDMPTLPGSLQSRFGWTFAVDSLSADGQMIVGHAVNRNGVVIGGVPIAAGSTIGVYWRAYPLPFTRFVVVSQPRVIGTFSPPALPAGWSPHPNRFTAVLATLKQFFAGTLEAYLSKPDTKATVLRTGSIGGYAYSVRGVDQFGEPSFAVIDKSGGVVVTEFPDISVTSISVSPDPSKKGLYGVNATISNDSLGPASGFTVTYSLVNQGDRSSSVFATLANTTGIGSSASLADTELVTPPVLDTDATYVITANVSFTTPWDTVTNSFTSQPFTVAGNRTSNEYSEIIIDTYVPTSANAGLMGGFDAVSLYDSSMRLIDEDLVGNNPDGDASGFAYIDHKGTLPSGTYYIRVKSRQLTPFDNGAYALRVLTAPQATEHRDLGWYFDADGDNTGDSALSYKVLSGGTVSAVALGGGSYEPDDAGPPGVPPKATMNVNQGLNRFLSSNDDVDWITLVLP